MIDRDETLRELGWWFEDLRGTDDQHRFAVEVVKYYDSGHGLAALVNAIPKQWHDPVLALLKRPARKPNPKQKRLFGWEIVARKNAGETLAEISLSTPMTELKTIQNLYYKAQKHQEEMEKLFQPIK